MAAGTTQGTGVEDMHGWWSLSYAQYLTIPRSVIQSMPEPWQACFAKLLNELDRSIDWAPKKGCYRVQLCEVSDEYDEDEERYMERWGAEIDDPLAEYNRGRRRLPLLDIPASAPRGDDHHAPTHTSPSETLPGITRS